jgi:hypothetical protein
MEYIGTIGATILFTVIFLIIYKYALNPTLVYTARYQDMTGCPDSWKYNAQTKMCDPPPNTTCLAFDPTQPQTAQAKCNIARTCGTTWNGFCG